MTSAIFSKAIAGLLVLHALLHLTGFAKAFGYAELPQLTHPISRGWGALWLIAAAVIFTSAAMFAAGARNYWIVGAVALVLSQTTIAAAWSDAWAGTIVNVLLLLVVAHGALTEGPTSFHARYRLDIKAGLSRTRPMPLVTDADLAPLPETVQRYLRATHVVGQPRVGNYRIRFRGRIRSAPDARWMPFEAEQHSFVDQPTRLFLMRARMFGVVPVQAFHRLIDGHATMKVKVVGAIPVADVHGEEMDRAETVTLFNDMCLLAPGTLLDSAIVWEPVDARTTRARFTHAGHTITATLLFDAEGTLENFWSDDRVRSTANGTFTPTRFSTPVSHYRDFGPLRLASYGEARWQLPEGEFTYGEFHMLDIVTNGQ